MSKVVIIGGVAGGASCAARLRRLDENAEIVLLERGEYISYANCGLPYYVGDVIRSRDALLLQKPEVMRSRFRVDVRTKNEAVSIDREKKTLRIKKVETGEIYEERYDKLVLATGSSPVRPPIPGIDSPRIRTLWTVPDTERLREMAGNAHTAAVIGGGFIGLEVAATARALGKAVEVLESAPRLLLRSVSPELAEHVLQVHRASGIDVRLGVAVGGFEIDGDRLCALAVDGVRHEIDTLLLGIGAVPEHTLATQAGLDCDNGIVVDAHMRSTDPAILAIGDCCSFPEPTSGRRLRLESVQNANDQAKTAVATLTGQPAAHAALPWFWSEQGSMRLQMAGLMPVDGIRHRRPGATPASFSVLHYVGDRLVSVESVNAPVDHMAARKLLEAKRSPPALLACDPATPLKSWL